MPRPSHRALILCGYEQLDRQHTKEAAEFDCGRNWIISKAATVNDLRDEVSNAVSAFRSKEASMFGHSANITLWISACRRPEPPHGQMLIQIKDDDDVHTLRDYDIVYIDVIYIESCIDRMLLGDNGCNSNWFLEETDGDAEGTCHAPLPLEDAKDGDTVDINEDPRRHLNFNIQQEIFKRPWKPSRDQRWRYSASGQRRTAFNSRGENSRGGKLARKRKEEKEEAERRRRISWETGSEPSQGYPQGYPPPPM